LRDLVSTYVNEELLAREARALELDLSDTVVRRRLAQKLTFLVEDTTRLAEPREDEVRRYFQAQRARYGAATRISFSQVFFSLNRGSQADADAMAALHRLSVSNEGDDRPESDPMLLGEDFVDVEPQAITGQFGAEFARAVFEIQAGQWVGPVRSAFGLHLVKVTKRSEGDPRPFEEVREAVLADWRRTRQKDTVKAYLDELREKHPVVVEDRFVPLLTSSTSPEQGR
jgi:hypothetical protein